MSDLPDDIWKLILEIGTETRRLDHRDLCRLSLVSRRFDWLTQEPALWATLLARDFPYHWLTEPPSKPLYLSKLVRFSWWYSWDFVIFDPSFEFKKRHYVFSEQGIYNPSMIRGVRRLGRAKWAAEIDEPNNGRRFRLGIFSSSHRAALAYDEAARAMYGTSAHLNFPHESDSAESATNHNHGDLWIYKMPAEISSLSMSCVAAILSRPHEDSDHGNYSKKQLRAFLLDGSKPRENASSSPCVLQNRLPRRAMRRNY